MQSYYRRFVRDFMRYKDEIQCYGAELVAAVRADARRLAPESNGEYYALHIRRGDLQFKVLNNDNPCGNVCIIANHGVWFVLRLTGSEDWRE